MDFNKSEAEHRYTSTGVKFWRHPEQMNAYREGKPGTVISTHIAPEGTCNLKCPYCSVTHRKVHNRISIDVIKDYVEKLMTLGLRAVILTGGGEPTIYPGFNELVQWLKYDCGLSVALITNGTQARRVQGETWRCFSWVRVSINLFDGWEEKIKIPYRLLRDDCVVGSSFVFTLLHEKPQAVDVELLHRVAAVARQNGARYVRLLPNCLLPQGKLINSHMALDAVLQRVGDDIFFHQHKLHRAPSCGTCHQSYFRPYLSEVPHWMTGKPGSVYPCDSVVLNGGIAKFTDHYQLCAPEQILDYMSGKIKAAFDPRVSCSGCVFTDNVETLGQWKAGEVDRFGDFPDPLIHEEFV